MGQISVSWPRELNEHGRPMLWFGSWLSGRVGGEGSWFYSGRGGCFERYDIPAGATGLRIRRWPNEGLDAEYADITAVAGLSSLDVTSLDFDAPQPYSRLSFTNSTPQEATP